jgi:hypothetical protein
VDDPGFQIRNFYPHMIAYPYRSLDPIRSNVHLLYKEQLRVAECLLAFLGSVGLALVAWTGVAAGAEMDLAAKFREDWQSGASPGDWQQLGQRSARLLRSYMENTVATGFAALWFKGRGTQRSELSEKLDRLVRLKNDFKHDRWPRTPGEHREGNDEAGRLLTDCLQAISFFIQHPIRLVVDADVEWQTGRAELDTLRYVGDHPGLTPEHLQSPEPCPRGSSSWRRGMRPGYRFIL